MPVDGGGWYPSLKEPPVKLCCGQRHWTIACPDGKVMCCVCFGRFPLDQLWKDPDGQLWDVCQTDGEAEERYYQQKRAE